MPLQGSGAISLEQIRNEFGSSSGPISMGDLYRGKGLVPDDAFCHNNTIPANNGISFNHFYKTTNGKNYTTYTASTTITLPANVFRVQVDVGGGGSGATMAWYATACAYPWKEGGLHIAHGAPGGYVKANISHDYVNGNKLQIVVGKGSSGAHFWTYYGQQGNPNLRPVFCRGRDTITYGMDSMKASDGGSSSVSFLNPSNAVLSSIVVTGGQGGIVRPWYGITCCGGGNRPDIASVVNAKGFLQSSSGNVSIIENSTNDNGSRTGPITRYQPPFNRSNASINWQATVPVWNYNNNTYKAYAGSGGGAYFKGEKEWDDLEVANIGALRVDGGGDGKVRVRY